jgi:hypothetical protein
MAGGHLVSTYNSSWGLVGGDGSNAKGIDPMRTIMKDGKIYKDTL